MVVKICSFTPNVTSLLGITRIDVCSLTRHILLDDEIPSLTSAPLLCEEQQDGVHGTRSTD